MPTAIWRLQLRSGSVQLRYSPLRSGAGMEEKSRRGEEEEEGEEL